MIEYLDGLITELRFEERVERYLTVFRTGRTPIVFPNNFREQCAHEQAHDHFQAEVEDMLGTNGVK